MAGEQMLVKAVWSGFLLSLSLCLDLGVVNAAVLRTVLRQGGTAGFVLGIGSSLGDLVYFTLAVFGAKAILAWPPLRWALWLFGTAVLLILAWRMIHEVIHPKELDTVAVLAGPRQSTFALLITGAGLALASPSAILWFAAAGGSVIASYGGGSLWPFAGGFFAAGILWSAFFAYGLAGARRVLGRRLVRMLAFVSALLFLYFAAVVFLNGLQQQ